MIEPVFAEIYQEIAKTRKLHPPFHSQHEAYAVILEELDEFWDCVRHDKNGRMELVQVAAMAVSAILELYRE